MTDVRTDGQRKRVFIRTYGCQMNVYDSDRMAELLRPLGYDRAEAADRADLVILNTCHIREHAAEKVYSELGRLRDLRTARRAEGGVVTSAVAGCVAIGRVCHLVGHLFTWPSISSAACLISIIRNGLPRTLL